MIGWVFALAGAAAGAAQAGLLTRSAQSGPWSLLTRLILVGAVLLLAARAGHLVVGAVGWLSGFGATCALVVRRLR